MLFCVILPGHILLSSMQLQRTIHHQPTKRRTTNTANLTETTIPEVVHHPLLENVTIVVDTQIAGNEEVIAVHAHMETPDVRVMRKTTEE